MDVGLELPTGDLLLPVPLDRFIEARRERIDEGQELQGGGLQVSVKVREKLLGPLQDAALPLQRQRPLHHLESLCDGWIDPSLLAPNQKHANSRERIYTPKLTFLSFLDQVLQPGSSCRKAVRQVQGYYQSLPHPLSIAEDTSAYCQARRRWTVEELVDHMTKEGLTFAPAAPGQEAAYRAVYPALRAYEAGLQMAQR